MEKTGKLAAIIRSWQDLLQSNDQNIINVKRETDMIQIKKEKGRKEELS